jgi:hypothetical protein
MATSVVRTFTTMLITVMSSASPSLNPTACHSTLE